MNCPGPTALTSPASALNVAIFLHLEDSPLFLCDYVTSRPVLFHWSVKVFGRSTSRLTPPMTPSVS